MNKSIWIINQYCGSRIHGMNFRSWYFANELQKKGHHPIIITGSFSHLIHKPPTLESWFKREEVEGIPYIWVKVRKYIGSKSLGRLISMIDFMFKLVFLNKRKLKKPDVIIVSSLSPFPILSAFFWSIKYQSKLLFEIRDIWPLSLIELGGVSRYNPLSMFFSFFERFGYLVSHKVISVLPCAKEHMMSKGMKENKFIYIPNGFSPDDSKIAKPLPKGYFDEIPKGKFLIGYTGSIGLANAVEYLVEASNHLEDDPRFHFVIIGKGQHKEKLQSLAGSNVSFLPLLDKAQVPNVLKKFNVCFIGLKNQKLFRFGISPNKIFEYMYAAKPIIQSIRAGNNPVREANAGFSVEPENAEEIKKAILKAYQMPKEDLESLGKNGYEYGLEKHSFEKLTERLISTFD